MYHKQLGKHRSLPTTCQTSEQNFKCFVCISSNLSTENDPNPTNSFNTTVQPLNTTRSPTPQTKYLLNNVLSSNTQQKPHITCYIFLLHHPPFTNKQTFFQSPFSHLTLQGTFLRRTCHLLAEYEKVQCCSQNPNSERLRYFVWFRPSNGHTWIFPADEVGMEKVVGW